MITLIIMCLKFHLLKKIPFCQRERRSTPKEEQMEIDEFWYVVISLLCILSTVSSIGCLWYVSKMLSILEKNETGWFYE